LPNTTWEAATGNESEALKTAYQLMGARVYIPALGRFAQLDPRVGGSANGYDYANQDPVNNSDPSGNASENWLVNGLTGLASFATGLLAGLFTRSATVGALVGAITGAAVTGISHAIEYLATGQTEFSAARLGISVLAGALGGGIVGRVKWAKAQNSSEGNVNRLSTTLDDVVENQSIGESSYTSGWTGKFSEKMNLKFAEMEKAAAKNPPQAVLKSKPPLPVPSAVRQNQAPLGTDLMKEGMVVQYRAVIAKGATLDGIGGGALRPKSVGADPSFDTLLARAFDGLS
jgi:RHS repeat-associated protein